MTNGDFSSMDEIRDVESRNVYAIAKKMLIPRRARWRLIKRTTRDNARTPMQWAGDEGAGFTKGEPWLKINKNHTWVNVEWERAQDGGLLDFWKRMIALRKNSTALTDGSFSSVYESRRIYAFLREIGDDKYMSVCNMSPRTVKLPKKLRCGSVELSSYAKPLESELLPFEYRLIKC